MSATWTDLDCIVQTNGTPSREPMGWWAQCSCGHRTPMVRSRMEARQRLERMHARKAVA